jgi:type VI secretion system VasD/TssJ family lipoprotein
MFNVFAISLLNTVNRTMATLHLHFGSMCRVSIGAFSLALVVILLQACAAANSALGGNSKKEAVTEVAWEFAANAVLVEIEADARLNEFAGEPHTLLMGVFQMEDPAVFYKLIADSTLVSKALETGKVDGFASFSRYVVSPGQRSILTIDRAQKAKFVGIFSGFYQMDRVKSARLFQIPLTVESGGLISTTFKAAPAVLALRLNFGPGELLNASRLNYDPAQTNPKELVPLDAGGAELKLGAQEVKRVLDLNNAVKKLDK